MQQYAAFHQRHHLLQKCLFRAFPNTKGYVIDLIKRCPLLFYYIYYLTLLYSDAPLSCADAEGGGRRSRPTLKNHKNVGFLSNTGPDPLKNH